jgi:hypothetical protein
MFIPISRLAPLSAGAPEPALSEVENVPRTWGPVRDAGARACPRLPGAPSKLCLGGIQEFLPSQDDCHPSVARPQARPSRGPQKRSLLFGVEGFSPEEILALSYSSGESVNFRVAGDRLREHSKA